MRSAMTRNGRHGRMGWLAVGVMASLAAACTGQAANDAPSKETGPAVLDIGTENTVRVRTDDVTVGPSVSGTLTPRVQASVRAEVGGAVLLVTAEQGQGVRRGQLLARIEARTAADGVTSAESSVRSQKGLNDLVCAIM